MSWEDSLLIVNHCQGCSKVSKYLFKIKINTSLIIFIMYLIMPNIISLHGFAFFVQFAVRKRDTSSFRQKSIFYIKLGPRSPQYSVDYVMVKPYHLLYIQRSSCGHLKFELLPSHHARFRIYSQSPKPILLTINS